MSFHSSVQGHNLALMAASKSYLQLERYQCSYATDWLITSQSVIMSYQQLWTLNALSPSPARLWCHEQQVLWIHLEQRGKQSLKSSLTHHKRGGRWGEELEVKRTRSGRLVSFSIRPRLAVWKENKCGCHTRPWLQRDGLWLKADGVIERLHLTATLS